MRINSYLTTLLAAGAAAFAIAGAPMAAAAPTKRDRVNRAPGPGQCPDHRCARRGCTTGRQVAATIRRGYRRPAVPPLRQPEPGRTALRTTVDSRREVLNQADGHPGKNMAKYLGVSRATLYRYLAPERAAQASYAPGADRLRTSS